MDAGRFSLDFNGSHLPAGSYLIEMRTTRERVVEKFVVVQ
jgi:hypothetical protein